MGAPGRLRSEIHGNVVDRAVVASVAVVVALGPKCPLNLYHFLYFELPFFVRGQYTSPQTLCNCYLLGVRHRIAGVETSTSRVRHERHLLLRNVKTEYYKEHYKNIRTIRIIFGACSSEFYNCDDLGTRKVIVQLEIKICFNSSSPSE
ncbi:hypothetical protein PUN28_002697 [Cardiocondyla obscurior]|uniref:Uncharacterized protein n=1 Tax=Cardiocondyla obscurior TaxID=286306 RepID=A0AAW2GVM9_9HYME